MRNAVSCLGSRVECRNRSERSNPRADQLRVHRQRALPLRTGRGIPRQVTGPSGESR